MWNWNILQEKNNFVNWKKKISLWKEILFSREGKWSKQYGYSPDKYIERTIEQEKSERYII